MTKEERAKLRATRRARAAVTLRQAQEQQTSKAASNAAESASSATAAITPPAAAASPGVSGKNARLLVYAGMTVPTLLLAWGVYDPDHSPPGKALEFLGLSSFIDEFAKPAHAKLLPDWSQMPNVPHDIPVPHTLVLDLENTLVSSTWDRKYGWRHAKRPGVDKFLHDMAQYYEIVLYSPSHEGVAAPVVEELDKTGCIMHRLYRDATYYIGGTHAKDLSTLNRNTNRIIAIDDDPQALQLQPQNLIRIKPYDNPHDREDRTLQRITPLLIEIAREGCNDVPALLRQFQGMDADEMADEHERRVQAMRNDRERSAQRGLGKLAVVGRRNLPPPELEAQDDLSTAQPVTNITSKSLVGEAPPKEVGGVVGWLNRRQKDQQEDQMRKMEKWNEVMMKKQMEKKRKEEELQKKMAA